MLAPQFREVFFERARITTGTQVAPAELVVDDRVLRRPEQRTEEQRAYMKLLRAEDAAIATAVDLAADPPVMLRRREGPRLAAWLDTAAASGIGDLERFAAKLRNDLAAVQAGLTLRHSNGQTEGQVTKLKLVKRQGYGRVKVDLLRKGLLRAA